MLYPLKTGQEWSRTWSTVPVGLPGKADATNLPPRPQSDSIRGFLLAYRGARTRFAGGNFDEAVFRIRIADI